VKRFERGLVIIGCLLFMCSCAGPKALLVFDYLFEHWLSPALEEINTFVVKTDDPASPSKLLHINDSTITSVGLLLRYPDVNTTSSSGFSSLDYCYSRGKRIAMKPRSKRGKCRALRLLFNPDQRLYDYQEDVIAKVQ
jgi:hypothetical protein